jgi:hypothetical protein
LAFIFAMLMGSPDTIMRSMKSCSFFLNNHFSSNSQATELPEASAIFPAPRKAACKRQFNLCDTQAEFCI